MHARLLASLRVSTASGTSQRAALLPARPAACRPVRTECVPDVAEHRARVWQAVQEDLTAGAWRRACTCGVGAVSK